MLPVGLKQDGDKTTCLTTVGLVVPEIATCDLRHRNPLRWHGVLALPQVPRGCVRAGDVLVWHDQQGRTRHAAIALNVAENLTWEMDWVDVKVRIPNYRLYELGRGWTVHRPRCPAVY